MLILPIYFSIFLLGQSTFEVVVMNSNAAVYAVNNFSKLTDCMDLNRDYLDMLDGLCDDG